MSSMYRKIMRNVQRFGAKRTTLNGSPSVGTRRARMDSAGEHQYRHVPMADGGPEPETAEEALEMPEELETEIPDEEINDDTAAVVAEETAGIEPEEEILDEISDPEASINEEEEEGISDTQLSVDWSGERIPEMTPPVSDGVDPSTQVEYTPGDNAVKEIQEPLPGLGEKLGVPPIINEVIDPSANVPEAPEE